MPLATEAVWKTQHMRVIPEPDRIEAVGAVQADREAFGTRRQLEAEQTVGCTCAALCHAVYKHLGEL